MNLNLLTRSTKRRSADLFVVGVFENEKPSKLVNALEPRFAKTLDGIFEGKRFLGKSSETFYAFNSEFNEAPEILLIGLGSRSKFTAALLRKAAGTVIRSAHSRKAKKIRLSLDSFIGGKVSSSPQALEALSETCLLAEYSFDKYLSKKKDENGEAKKIEALEFLLLKAAEPKKLEKHIEFSRIVAEGTIAARNLVNEPGNVINPQKLVEEARKVASAKKLKLTVLGVSELKRLKMGGILSVNQGSKVPPALIVLEYGAAHARRGTICLVGKGVTFDTGGISIKPAGDMEKMKYDKAGACAVIAAMGVIADLKLPLHVVGLAPTVENMPSEDPQRPGDIIRMHSGKTVEVINTDAEGRLILGDALSYAAKYKPKAIIDFATLTGMVVYTFADKAIGLMGNDRRLMDRIKQAGEETGERCWELPMWDDYSEMIKGHHSDLLNAGGKYAGTITAAKFLEEFVPEKTAWAHLDIAGTAWCDSPRYDCVKGATGAGVRLIAHLLKNWK